MADASPSVSTPQNPGAGTTCQNCRFARDAQQPQSALMASDGLVDALMRNIAPFTDGPNVAHGLLRHRPGYTAEAVDAQLERYRALPEDTDSQNARSCIRIKAEGYLGCPAGGCVLPSSDVAQAPADLAAWGRCIPIEVLPAVMARHIINREFPDGLLKLYNQIYRYCEGIWQCYQQDDLAALVLMYLGIEAVVSKIKQIAKLIELMATKVHTITPSPDHICFRNGTYDVQRQQMVPHAPGYWLLNRIGFDYIPEETCPAFLGFVDETFDGDTDKDDKIKLLQEWFGLCLTANVLYQIMLILLGDGANGKSVIEELLRRIVGAENSTTAELHRYQNADTRATLKHKLLNVSADLSMRNLGGDGNLKAIISGDAIEVSPKFIRSHSIKPYAKLMACSNYMPSTADTSEGYSRRFRVLRLNHVVPTDQRDPHLLGRLAQEIPGIIAWSIQGLLRLTEQGRLTEPESSALIVDAYRAENDPLRLFADECLRSLPQDSRSGYKPKDIYRAYQAWCNDHGHPVKASTVTLGRRLSAMGIQWHRSDEKIWHVAATEDGMAYFPAPVAGIVSDNTGTQG